MSETVAIKFLHGSAPYEAGDVAGFSSEQARRYVDSGRAEHHTFRSGLDDGAGSIDVFAGMDRAALVAYARDELGMADEPPADVSDEALREVLRQHAAAPWVPAATIPAAKAKGGKA